LTISETTAAGEDAAPTGFGGGLGALDLSTSRALASAIPGGRFAAGASGAADFAGARDGEAGRISETSSLETWSLETSLLETSLLET
jgi:hypothetical protein